MSVQSFSLYLVLILTASVIVLDKKLPSVNFSILEEVVNKCIFFSLKKKKIGSVFKPCEKHWSLWLCLQPTWIDSDGIRCLVCSVTQTSINGINLTIWKIGLTSCFFNVIIIIIHIQILKRSFRKGLTSSICTSVSQFSNPGLFLFPCFNTSSLNRDSF